MEKHQSIGQIQDTGGKKLYCRRTYPLLQQQWVNGSYTFKIHHFCTSAAHSIIIPSIFVDCNRPLEEIYCSVHIQDNARYSSTPENENKISFFCPTLFASAFLNRHRHGTAVRMLELHRRIQDQI